MAQTLSTRRFEMGLPLFGGLDLGLIATSQDQIGDGSLDGLTSFVSLLAGAAKIGTVRKLSAIWTAPDGLLKLAESDPAVLATLEAEVADKPFSEAFADAMAFQSALWKSLGATPVSSGPGEQKNVDAAIPPPAPMPASPSEG